MRQKLPESARTHPRFAELTNPKFGIYDAKTHELVLDDFNASPAKLTHDPIYMEKLSRWRDARAALIPIETFFGHSMKINMKEITTQSLNAAKEYGIAVCCFIYNHLPPIVNFLAPIANPIGYDVQFDTYMPADFSVPPVEKVYPGSARGSTMYKALQGATEMVIGVSSPFLAAAYHLTFVETELSPKAVRDTLVTCLIAKGLSRYCVVPSAHGQIGLGSHVHSGNGFALDALKFLNEEALNQGLSNLLISSMDGKEEIKEQKVHSSISQMPVTTLSEPSTEKLAIHRPKAERFNVSLAALPIALTGGIDVGMGLLGVEYGVSATVLTFSSGSLVLGPVGIIAAAAGVFLYFHNKKIRKEIKEAIADTKPALEHAEKLVHYQNSHMQLAMSASSLEKFNEELRCALSDAYQLEKHCSEQLKAFDKRKDILEKGLSKNDFKKFKDDVEDYFKTAMVCFNDVEFLCNFASRPVQEMHHLLSLVLPQKQRLIRCSLDYCRQLLIKKLFLTLDIELKNNSLSRDTLNLVDIALAYENRNPELHYIRGVLLLSLEKNISKAIDEIELSIALEPSNANRLMIIKSLATAYYYRALAILNDIKKLNPWTIEFKVFFPKVCSDHASQIEKAIQMIQRVQTISTSNAEEKLHLENLSVILIGLKKQVAISLDQRIVHIFQELKWIMSRPDKDVTLGDVLENAKIALLHIEADRQLFLTKNMLNPEDAELISGRILKAHGLVEEILKQAQAHLTVMSVEDMPIALLLKNICQKHLEYEQSGNLTAAKALAEELDRIGFAMNCYLSADEIPDKVGASFDRKSVSMLSAKEMLSGIKAKL